jgi:hypothetical protein
LLHKITLGGKVKVNLCLIQRQSLLGVVLAPQKLNYSLSPRQNGGWPAYGLKKPVGQVIARMPLNTDCVNHKHRSIILFFENLSFTEKASWF